jgi:hypothetical protein
MANHSATLTHNLKLELDKSGTEIQVRADGDLLGTLTLRGGSIDWGPVNKQHVLSLSWSEFAELMNERYASSK